MRSQFQPWQFLLLILAGWINRRQQDAVEYLITENRIRREKIGKKQILLNDDRRRRLAVKGKILGRRVLEQLATIVTPDTILRWHRELVARHWDHSRRRENAGRPPVSPVIVELVLRIARENPMWARSQSTSHSTVWTARHLQVPGNPDKCCGFCYPEPRQPTIVTLNSNGCHCSA